MPDTSTSRPGARVIPPHQAWLSLAIVEDAGDWNSIPGVVALVETAAAAVGKHAAFASEPHSEACIALSDDNAVQRLNNNYRHKDKPTNVLSFPSGVFVTEGGPRPLGDVIVALETLVREAEVQGIEVGRHLQHLTVHGLLHLLGYDHETDQDARRMEALEVEILAGIGVANPYEGLELAGDEAEPEGSRRLSKQTANRP